MPLKPPEPIVIPEIVKLAFPIFSVPLVSARVSIIFNCPPIKAWLPIPVFMIRLPTELPLAKFNGPPVPDVELIVTDEGAMVEILPFPVTAPETVPL